MSNQEFSDAEYNKWIEASTAASLSLPTKETIDQKMADIREAITYEYNEQDIERIVNIFLFYSSFLSSYLCFIHIFLFNFCDSSLAGIFFLDLPACFFFTCRHVFQLRLNNISLNTFINNLIVSNSNNFLKFHPVCYSCYV